MSTISKALRRAGQEDSGASSTPPLSLSRKDRYFSWRWWLGLGLTGIILPGLVLILIWPIKPRIDNGNEPHPASIPINEYKPSPGSFEQLTTASEHVQAADLARQGGRMEDAIHHLRQAILLEPRHRIAYLTLGNIFFYNLADSKKAEEMFKQVLRLDPENKLAHNNLGVLLMRNELLTLAQSHFQAALDQDPDYVDALYNLACLSARLGQESQAIAYLQEASRLEPQVVTWAAQDEDLKGLSRNAEFKKLIRTRSPKRAIKP